MLDSLKDYFREKRIRRILSFYHDIQPLYSNRKAPFISRDAWIHFIVTMIFFLVFGRIMRFFPSIFSFFIVGFLAVETADFITIRGARLFDAIFDYVLPIGFFLLIGVAYFGQKHFKLIDKAKVSFTEFHKNKNRELHGRIQKNIATVGLGENWVIEGFSAGNVKPMSLEEAKLACQKLSYKIYDGESFDFTPPLVLNRPAYFWNVGKAGTNAAQLDPGEVRKPTAWVSGGTEPMHLTLCVKP